MWGADCGRKERERGLFSWGRAALLVRGGGGGGLREGGRRGSSREGGWLFLTLTVITTEHLAGLRRDCMYICRSCAVACAGVDTNSYEIRSSSCVHLLIRGCCAFCMCMCTGAVH